MFRTHEPALSSLTGRPFERLITRLGETFVVRDVMIPLDQMECVRPGEEDKAGQIIREKRFSVVPASKDHKTFHSVFNAEHRPRGEGTTAKEAKTKVSDHIPDSTPLAEAFSLFDAREWYLTIRANRVSGLITYWAFNSHEFRVQLYTGLSRIEELSRKVLETDGCGISDETGLSLSAKAVQKIRRQIGPVWKSNGGNRFVDELGYRQVHTALSKHKQWREFLARRLNGEINNSGYGQLFNFADLRNDVMHGRTLFPTYGEFTSSSRKIRRIGQLIDHLDAYLALPAESKHMSDSDLNTAFTPPE
jgi:hypothetical protein